jgi:hypothetical protein
LYADERIAPLRCLFAALSVQFASLIDTLRHSEISQLACFEFLLGIAMQPISINGYMAIPDKLKLGCLFKTPNQISDNAK